MRAITLFQPWATLIAIGAKRLETRSWSTDYRGPLAIHAGAQGHPHVDDLAITNHPAFVDKLSAAGYERTVFLGRPGPWRVPHSAIVAVVDLEECLRVEELERSPINVYEHAFGNYAPGRFAWRLGNLRALTTPVRCRGFQRLWNLSPATWTQVEAQLA